MAINSAPLNLLVFPQRWLPQSQPPSLSLTVLVLPQGDPLTPLDVTVTPFADADLVLDAMVVPTLAALPTLPAAQRIPLTGAQPVHRRALFEALAATFEIRPATAPTEQAPAAVRKFLPHSYRAATRYIEPRSPYLVTDHSYTCALKAPFKASPPKTPDPRLEWEEVIAFVLRQPLLARELGLIHDRTLHLTGADPFAQGGYLFADLAATSAYRTAADNDPGLLARFAARIPPLVGAPERPVFAPVLFPVTGVGTFDEVFAEAEAYDSGFARVVHGAQPRSAAQVEHDPEPPPGGLAPVKDTGIRLGWDDEQVTVWLNRQFGVNALDNSLPSPDAPLGVAGYRVDVCEDDDPLDDWHSLTHVTGDLELAGIAFGHFDGELCVETNPVNHTFQPDGEFWLPSYFTAWTGGSLVVRDRTPFRLGDAPPVVAAVYEAVDADSVPLRYGRTYRFRVRMTDLTGGGPVVTDRQDDTAPAPTAVVPFRRFVPPGAVRVAPGGGVGPDGRTASYDILRPPLGYPDVVYTGLPNAVTSLLADVAAAKDGKREAALPDPDVTQLRVDVLVRTVDGDPAADSDTGQPFEPLYSVLREYDPAPEHPLTLRAVFEDVHSAGALKNIVLTATEPLRLPTARDVRLVLTAVGREDPTLAYWGSQESRNGAVPVSVYLRAPSRDETALLKPPSDGPEIQAVFLQPDALATPNLAAQLAAAGLRHDAPSDLVDRLARELGLAREGLTLSARAGRRLVIGATAGLRQVTAPDRASVTFATRDDLTRQWLVCVRLTVDRDWTWDALAPVAFELRRDNVTVGSLELPRTVSRAAIQQPDREHTDILFLDAFDPKPGGGKPPARTEVSYTLIPVFRTQPAQTDPARQWTLTLPITTPPTQVPQLVSAGFAASAYVRDQSRYATTDARRRSLYLEFAEPPQDDQDRYFARVLAYGPDPMLLDDDLEIPDPAEPPLCIDEPIRVITPGASNDFAGLTLMRELITSDDRRHCLLPLPEGMDPDSPELFGFFVYEVRVGHDGSRWSTAAGRFGLPLRVAGVQHPTPQLRCAVSRTPRAVRVSAPHAGSASEGRDVRPFPPKTTISALLYARVAQADGRDWRNVLLYTLSGPGTPREWEGFRGDRRFPQSAVIFPYDEIRRRLRALGLPPDAALGVLAVEMLPEPGERRGDRQEPLADGLGTCRILRTSPLTEVPDICPPKPGDSKT
ncbi:hypothetical protein [Streptomyces sp. NPDC002671]